MPVPSQLRLTLPQIESHDPENAPDNMRALDRWANGICPAGKDFIQKQTLTQTANNITFLNIPKLYNSLEFTVMVQSDQPADNTILLRFNDDANSANYIGEYLLGIGASITSANIPPGTATGNQSGLAPITANRCSALYTSVLNYQSTTFQKNSITWGGHQGSLSVAFFVANYWLSLAPVTKVAFVPTTGNFTTGSSIIMYGVI